MAHTTPKKLPRDENKRAKAIVDGLTSEPLPVHVVNITLASRLGPPLKSVAQRDTSRSEDSTRPVPR